MAEGTLTFRAESAFSFGVHCELIVAGYRKAALSIPGLTQGESLRAKDLLSSGEVAADGKFTLEQHLHHLQAQGALEPRQPLLVVGARNNLVNLRCPVVIAEQVHGVEGEDPLRSRRPYYGIGFRGNRFECATLLCGGSDPSAWDFFCAGIPVLWDDLDDEALFDVMLAETADHSHLFDLPRGNHPAATDATREAWAALHRVFTEHLYSPDAAAEMRKAVRRIEPPLRRCEDYFHAVTGVREDGALICLFAQGRLEDLGKIMRRRGCRRAVCLENSGSIMPTLLPKGLEGEATPLVRAPNFRQRGRAIIAIALENAGFVASPLGFQCLDVSLT